MTVPLKPRRRKDSGVGARLAELRHEARLSQAEVARRMDCDPAKIWQVENGRLDIRLSTLLRITDAIGARIHIGLIDPAHTGSSSPERE